MKIETKYKSALEERVAARLEQAGVKFRYEGLRLEFLIPERKARYTPDFPIDSTPIIIEAKGRFGHRNNDDAGAAARHRLILAKEQNPDVDIRIVFQNASYKIGKNSKTTYGQWATDHGFTWSDKGTVPASWIEDIKQASKRKS